VTTISSKIQSLPTSAHASQPIETPVIDWFVRDLLENSSLVENIQLGSPREPSSGPIPSPSACWPGQTFSLVWSATGKPLL